jgi:DNA repair protein RadD
MQRLQNSHLRVIGFTATPFRMTGPLCHKDHILQEICYEANIFSLIQDGYLCRLWSRRGEHQPDLSQVKRNHGGDYVVESLAKAVDTESVVRQAVSDAMQHIRLHNRKHSIWFCVDVEHCNRVSRELRLHGVNAPAITASTPHRERDRVAADFKSGRLQAICNVNVYTEGFNAKLVDCIVLLRPTLSKGLYQQMCGRGLRVHPEKTDGCLVLDYAHCIDEHGPIDALGPGDAPLYDCQKCGNVFSRQVRKCPHCGWEIPKPIIEKLEAEERERRLHEIKASNRNILSGEPEEIPVEEVRVHRHLKDGMPDSLRIEYRCGLCVVREWVCLDHQGFAGQKAKAWWQRRFGGAAPSVNGALENLFLANQLKEITKSVTVVRNGKYREIIKHTLNAGSLNATAP